MTPGAPLRNIHTTALPSISPRRCPSAGKGRELSPRNGRTTDDVFATADFCRCRVRYTRTHQVPLPQQDPNNFYQSCALITPGPGSFGGRESLLATLNQRVGDSGDDMLWLGDVAVKRYLSMGEDMRTFRPRVHNRVLGLSARDCLKSHPETVPGPSAYEKLDSSVIGEPLCSWLHFARDVAEGLAAAQESRTRRSAPSHGSTARRSTMSARSCCRTSSGGSLGSESRTTSMSGSS
jgi:hypothetical protein